MGATLSSPLVPPPLLDATNDSEERVPPQSNNASRNEEETNDEKADDVSIVFFDGDEDEDEGDLYYDDRDDSLCTDQFRCFGVPFLGSIQPPLFTTGPAIIRVDTQPEKSTAKGNSNIDEDEDEDEDPREGIETLQQELRAVDEIYNHDGDGDDDPQADVEMLQRELQQAEENYVPPELESIEHEDYLGSSDHTLLSDGIHPAKSSSFIDLQHLLFHSGESVDDNDDQSSITKTGSVSSSATVSLFSTSSTTSRVVEIYETRTTQLRPQPESEKERLPMERMGVPFRKCCNSSCSCHHPTTRSRHSRRSNNHYHTNRANIDRHRAIDNNDGVEIPSPVHNDDGVKVPSPIDDQLLKRRNALRRLKKQREKLRAMNADEDDQTALTTGSSSSLSLYSGHSIRSECLINTRKNQFLDKYGNRNSNLGHRRKRSFSEDHNEGGIHAEFLREITMSGIVPPGVSANATSSSLCTISRQFSPPKNEIVEAMFARQTKQRCSQPPLPSRRSSGETNYLSQGATRLTMMQSNSNRLIRPDPFREANKNNNEIARRCRSEDFIDGSGSNLFDCHARSRGTGSASAISKDYSVENRVFCKESDQQSLHLLNATVQFTENVNDDQRKQTGSTDGRSRCSNVGLASTTSEKEMWSGTATNQSHPDAVADTKEGDDPSMLGSPTCIMEEIHRTDSFQRSRTTQHEPQHLPQQRDGLYNQQWQGFAPPVDPSGPTTSVDKAPVGQNCDDRNDKPNRSHLFEEREQRLKKYRRSIRVLQHQEKMERRQKYPTTQTTLNKAYRKRQKRRRQKQQQRDFERSMQLADLYHNMGLIHYQQARYDTARHVFQCGIDALIAHRASSVPFATEVYEETTDPFEDDYFDQFTSYSSPSRLLPPLPTLDEAAPHLAPSALLLAAELVLAQGKVFAAQGFWNQSKESSGKVLQWSDFQKQRMLGQSSSSHRRQEDAHHQANLNASKYWTHWGSTRARAQVLFARCFQHERRPDIAMGYYREALSVQQCVLGPWHLQSADTLYRMGTIYAASGMLGLAGQCFEEALVLYRRHRNRAPDGAPLRLPEDGSHGHGEGRDDSLSSSMACVAADEATVLAGLGWIFLVQRDPARALVLTNQALDGMVHALGPSHTNVLALHHQLVYIEGSLASACQDNNDLQHYRNQHSPGPRARHR